MSELNGWKSVSAENSDFTCKKCGSHNLKYRIVEDSDCHEDINYWCPDCKYEWWVEGPDY